jgi:hypothetical protein
MWGFFKFSFQFLKFWLWFNYYTLTNFSHNFLDLENNNPSFWRLQNSLMEYTNGWQSIIDEREISECWK